ncbi:MAG: substrate-binding domain-containing protein [Clostridiales bacterium]|nr:substrate-binding domain-containing protein [Clostridiales bacterium]
MQKIVKAKPVRMADIAQKLDISTVAVSKALAGQKGVSEELRSKVKAMAEEMGYRSPGVVRMNRQAKGFNIGVLIPERYVDFSESFYWRVHQELAKCAMPYECFTLLEVLSDGVLENHQQPKLITENKVDGIIMIGCHMADYASAIKNAWDKPIVFLDFYDAGIAEDSIISNGFLGSYLMTNYLIERGHSDIGFVGTLLTTSSITDRYLGYFKAMMEHRLCLKAEWVLDDRDAETGRDIPIALPRELPTAFVCNCDHAAVRLAKTLGDCGLNVPDDISIVGFDNYQFVDNGGVGITTYEVDVPEMAKSAIRVLIAKLTDTPYKRCMRVTGGRIIERESVKVLNK